MARHFAKIDEWEKFIPDIGNERKLAKDKPEEALTVELRMLTELQKRFLIEASRDGSVEKMQQVFEENVRNVKNYSMDGEPIETGLDLAKRGEPLIIAQVTAAMIDRASLDEGLAKKLKSPSDFMPWLQKMSAGGDARSVTQE